MTYFPSPEARDFRETVELAAFGRRLTEEERVIVGRRLGWGCDFAATEDAIAGVIHRSQPYVSNVLCSLAGLARRRTKNVVQLREVREKLVDIANIAAGS